MDISKSRKITFNEIALVFAACVFPIHLWSIWNLMQVVPAWILRSTVWELAGFIAYTQLFALIESLIVLAVLVGIGLLLPYRMFANKFTAYSSLFILINTIWFVVLQYNYSLVRAWGARQLIPWIALYLLTLVVSYLVLYRGRRIETIIQSVIKRVAVLSYIYVTFSLFSLFIVILRNL